MTARPRVIVAEISKNWQGGVELEPGLLSERFEYAINENRRRGYRLDQFQLHRLMTGPDTINETIIAVFELINPVW
jgi:hypothetical protein